MKTMKPRTAQYSQKFVKMMGKVRQTPHDGRMEQCNWR
jgi:hypothetical protein